MLKSKPYVELRFLALQTLLDNKKLKKTQIVNYHNLTQENKFFVVIS